MKSFAGIALFLCPFAAFAEEAEQPMEHTGAMGVVLFFAVVVAAGVWFFISMNNAARKKTKTKDAEKH